MVRQNILIKLVLGVILLWRGEVECHPVMLYYNSGQQQNQLRNNDISLVMPPEAYGQSPAQAEDRMDTGQEQDDISRSSTFSFPPPPPLLMPIFQQVQPYSSPNDNVSSISPSSDAESDTNSTKRFTRTAVNPGQNFNLNMALNMRMGESSPETFWNFPQMEGMFRFSPPFLVPAYASLPTPTQGPETARMTSGPQYQPSQPQSQPISYQIPILNNGYQPNFQPPRQPQPMVAPQYFPQQGQPNSGQGQNQGPQPQWQVQPLSPELEAAIFGQYAYQGPPQHVQVQPQPQSYNMNMPYPMSHPPQPQRSTGYFTQNQQPPLPPQSYSMTSFPNQMPQPQQMIPQMYTQFAPPPPPPPPSQVENYDGSQSTTKGPGVMSLPLPSTTTQYPLTHSLSDPRPEILSTTTPTPGTTSYYGLYSYASAHGDYSKDDISIEKFDHVIGKDGYNVGFKTENGINSKEEGHLKQVMTKSNYGEKSVYSPASESRLGVVHVKSGQVSWTSPECITFTLRYEADEFGYRPSIQESPASNLECLKYGKNYEGLGSGQGYGGNVYTNTNILGGGVTPMYPHPPK